MSDVVALGKAGVAIRKANDAGRGALVGYLPAGFPTYDGAVDGVKAMIDGGADVIELGLPYSDPVMDGVTIQRATEVARAADCGPGTCSARSRSSRRTPTSRCS